MSTELSSGTVLKTINGKSLSVKKFIGSGGQGSVYIVDYCGRDMALKWYNPAALGDHPEKFRNNLISNMRKGAPSKEFLWPLDVTEDKNDSFGYVMELRPDDYYEMSCFMVKKVEFSSHYQQLKNPIDWIFCCDDI